MEDSNYKFDNLRNILRGFNKYDLLSDIEVYLGLKEIDKSIKKISKEGLDNNNLMVLDNVFEAILNFGERRKEKGIYAKYIDFFGGLLSDNNKNKLIKLNASPYIELIEELQKRAEKEKIDSKIYKDVNEEEKLKEKVKKFYPYSKENEQDLELKNAIERLIDDGLITKNEPVKKPKETIKL